LPCPSFLLHHFYCNPDSLLHISIPFPIPLHFLLLGWLLAFSFATDLGPFLKPLFQEGLYLPIRGTLVCVRDGFPLFSLDHLCSDGFSQFLMQLSLLSATLLERTVGQCSWYVQFANLL
jgi:hypothetical protein